MRNTNKKISNEYSRATILKLRYIIAIGALISLTACSSYTLHSSEPGLAVSSYPVIQF